MLKYFILYLLLEIASFAFVGKYLGVFLTLVLVVATTLLGFWVVRRFGAGMNMQVMQQMQRTGRMPENMPNGFNMIAGFLLILPGFITDLMGLLLLIPAVQKLVLGWFTKKSMAPNPMAANQANLDQGNIIEGEVEETDTPDDGQNK